MIISHKHKYIFIKTQKTAGTSVEIALSRYCGPDDVITPISPKDELVRQELGGRGPQNYRIPIKHWTPGDIREMIAHRQVPQFYNHCAALFIKRHIDPHVWNTYYKFCFERDPYTKTISWFNWINSSKGWDFSDFLDRHPKAFQCDGYHQYTIDGRRVVDDVYKYEEMEDAMQKIAHQVGLPEVPELPKTKVTNNKRQVQLTERDREVIAQVYAREIALLNY